MKAFALVTLLACHASRAPSWPTTPLAVRVTEMPERPSCYISTPPEPPSLIEYEYDDDDIIRRAFVHLIKGNEIVQYQIDSAMWMAEARVCIYVMMGQEP